MAVVVCDLDGVMWRGDQPVGGSADAVARLRAAGLRVGFVTNNSSATIGQYVDRLDGMGVPTEPDDVLSSATAAAHLVARRHRAGARVLVCAGPGVVEALEDAGFDVVPDGEAEAVVVGWHDTFDFSEMTGAARTIRGGAELVATNLDPTYPTPDGFVAGNGSIVAGIATAAGVAPIVAGKPEPPMAELVHERFGHHGVMVGDRPSTDGATAAALGWPFALVLSGIAGDGEEPIPDPPPAFVGDDLAAVVPDLVKHFIP
jgi:HAD superfamily hydrolase (TIGR01450 family)